jgi:hypothetical protein
VRANAQGISLRRVSKRLDRPYVSGSNAEWIKVKWAQWREDNQWRHEFFKK